MIPGTKRKSSLGMSVWSSTLLQLGQVVSLEPTAIAVGQFEFVEREAIALGAGLVHVLPP